MIRQKIIGERKICYHCGEPVVTGIEKDEHTFCCEGCSLVYELLKENNLCTYYSLTRNPGQKGEPGRFDFLDEPAVKEKLIHYREGSIIHLRWRIPSMHCSSCIWLLEHLGKMNDGIVYSKTDFVKKELSLVIDENKTQISEAAQLLANLGYRPLIESEKADKPSDYKSMIYRIGVAGFCFANIMMLSLPDYFSGGKIGHNQLERFFPFLNLILSLPVFFYSSAYFFKNSWEGLKQRTAVIDLPISIGIIAMFARSLYDILTSTGSGYLDSMAGLVFFMLIGRKFQDYTFDWLKFEREFKSYFPIAITIKDWNGEKTCPVEDVKPGQTALIRNNEIVPFDSILLNGKAWIDYSFITGESRLVEVNPKESIYAGGRQKGGIIEVLVKNTASKSHLETLWNQSAKKEKSRFKQLTRAITHWFMIVTFSVAVGSFVYWQVHNPPVALHAFTSVLVIACACALLLSSPFTFGNLIRLLGKNKIYLRNHHVIEQLASVDTIVFDKTGTLTQNENPQIADHLDKLTDDERNAITVLLHQSVHPLSRMLLAFLQKQNGKTETPVSNYIEEAGAGIAGTVKGLRIRIGKSSFAGKPGNSLSHSSRIHISINDEYKGYVEFGARYRSNLSKMMKSLRQAGYELHVLSGDHPGERDQLEKLSGRDTFMQFEASPSDKKNYVEKLQMSGKKVLMVGDGLNDTGALMQSDAGIAISESVNNFNPSCDVLMDAREFHRIPHLLKLSKLSIVIINISFVLALAYNVLAVSVAAAGNLSPVFAAILMPISTTSLVAFTVGFSSLAFKRIWKSRHAAGYST